MSALVGGAVKATQSEVRVCIIVGQYTNLNLARVAFHFFFVSFSFLFVILHVISFQPKNMPFVQLIIREKN